MTRNSNKQLATKQNFPLLIIPVLIIVTICIHGGTLDGHWRWDDTQILKHILLNSVSASFFDPDIYELFSSTNLFPWILLSSKVDLILFGLIPLGFYVHQLLAIVAAAIVLFLVCRQWMSSLFALYGTIIFLSGTPVTVISEQLMTRHYIEGLIFTLLAIYYFTCHLRKPSRLHLILSVLAYTIAVTCKEIYVPLILLLPLVPENNFSERIKAIKPFIGIVFLYVFWRRFMLDTVLGGYSGPVEIPLSQLLTSTLSAFSQIPNLLFPYFTWLAASLFILLLLGYIYTSKSALLFTLYSLALILGPLLPLVVAPGITAADRYLLLVWVGFSFCVPFYCQQIASKSEVFGKFTAPILVAALTSLSLLSLYNSRLYLANLLLPIAAEYDAHASFIMEEDNTSAYIPGPTVLASYWFTAGLEDMIVHLQSPDAIPVDVVDDSYLLQDNLINLYTYDAGCRCMQDISATIAGRIARFNARILPQEPLELLLDYQGWIFFWKFGPYEEGEYHLISSRLGAFPLPKEGSQRVSIVEEVPFTLRYTSPQGWITYSPELILDPDGDATKWTRNQD